MKNTQIWMILAMISILWSSCQKNDDLFELQPTQVDMATNPLLTPLGGVQENMLASGMNCTVQPVQVVKMNNGGNVDCNEVGTYSSTSGRVNYNSGTFDASWPMGFTVTVTDGKYVTWSFDLPGYCLSGISVIVKGGNAPAHVYTYDAGCSGGADLKAPLNNGNQQAGLSNLTFCYNLIPCGIDCTNRTETGFGGNTAGAGKAWWFAFDIQGAATQFIYAGKVKTDGTVTWDGTKLTINLGSWSLQNVSEPVKVQGYSSLPTSRQPAGLFTLYKGSNLMINGNGSRYYVVHLDLAICE